MFLLLYLSLCDVRLSHLNKDYLLTYLTEIYESITSYPRQGQTVATSWKVTEYLRCATLATYASALCCLLSHAAFIHNIDAAPLADHSDMCGLWTGPLAD